MARGNRRGYTGEQTRDHGNAEAERLTQLAQKELEIGDWTEWKKGDWRKGLVAVLIRQRSLVDNGWLAERLAMGSRPAVSRMMREAREHLQSNRKAKALGRHLEKQIDQT